MLATILAGVALFLAAGARKQSSDVLQRLLELENSLSVLRGEIGWLRSQERPPGSGATAPKAQDESNVAPRAPLPKTETAAPDAPRNPQAPQSVPVATPQATAAATSTDEPAKPSGSFEEKLGTQWAVWAGGIALALGGLFLVRYTIEAGLIGPGVRLVMGALLAALLVTGGEWLRRRDIKLNIEGLPDAHIPSVLTAAGTIVAFGTIYAAYALYGFIGSGSAFIMLGATGIATMLAAAIHGPTLAGLGLLGAFGTPLLVASNNPNYWALVLYLMIVAASAYALARVRSWKWLATAALGGAVLWGLPFALRSALSMLAPSAEIESATLAYGLLQLALAAGFLAYEPHVGTRDQNAVPDRFATIALSVLAILMIGCLFTVSFSHWAWFPATTIAVAILTVTGWLSAQAAASIAIGGLLAFCALTNWPGLQLPPDQSLLLTELARVLRLPENVYSYLAWSALWTVPPAIIAGYRIWRGPLLPTPTAALYALGATVPPLLALVLAYLRVTQFDTSIPFALGGAGLAAIFAMTAARFQNADRDLAVPSYHFATGAFAAAAIAALSFALITLLSRGYLTVAFALTALGSAYVSSLRDIPLLRHAVTALGGLVIARLFWDPRIMGGDVGQWPIFNWLLVGYGIPAFAFATAARMLEKRSDDMSVRISDALSVVFAGLLAFFQIRHLTNGGDVLHRGSGHVEAGLLTLVALSMSYVLARMHMFKKNSVFDTAATILGAVSVCCAVFGLAVFSNPYIVDQSVTGAPFFSSLTLAYLLPGIAALFVARNARGLRPDWYVRSAGILAVALIFAYVTFSVRQLFQGSEIVWYRGTSDVESWAHSVAWLLLGILFLGYGLLRGSLEARMASAALIVLAAFKVTIFDLAGIGGIWRALSFLCLGAVLIGIGLVYQRFVFNGKPPSTSPS